MAGHPVLSGIRGSLHAPTGASKKFGRSVAVDSKKHCIPDANFSVGEPLPHPSSRWPWALSVYGAGAEDSGNPVLNGEQQDHRNLDKLILPAWGLRALSSPPPPSSPWTSGLLLNPSFLDHNLATLSVSS